MNAAITITASVMKMVNIAVKKMSVLSALTIHAAIVVRYAATTNVKSAAITMIARHVITVITTIVNATK
jgi:hypothetical protein